MADLFDRLDAFDKARNTPNAFGQFPKVQGLPEVLPSTGFGSGAGYAPIEDMPTRSRYDAGRMEGQNIDDFRSDHQGGWALTGAFLGRTLGTGAAKLLEGVSMLGSAAVGLGSLALNKTGLLSDENSMSFDDVVHNPVNKLFFDLEDKIKEIMPVYHSSNWADRSVSNKFFHNFGEWMADQGADGVAFALSALIPGVAVSKLGLGASILGDASRGLSSLGETLAAAGATEKVLAATSKGIDLAAQYGVQTSSEALFEAKDTGEQLMNRYLAKLNEDRPDYAKYKTINDLPQNMQTDIKDKMAGAMKNDFGWNMIALAPSNLFEIGLINKFVGKAESTALKGLGKEINAGEDIAAEAAKTSAKTFEGIGSGKFKTLSKSIYDSSKAIGATRLGSALKVIPEAIAAEGLYEENIQNQLQDMSMQYGLQGKSGYFLDSGFNAAKQAVEAITPSHFNDPKYKDTRESIFAGAVIGALFGGVAGATTEFNHERDEKVAHKAATNNAINFLNSAKSDFLKQDLYETEDVKQADGTIKKQIKFDGVEPIINKTAAVNFLGNQARMSDLVNSEEYFSVTGQKEMAQIIRDERTTNWALSHLQSGKGDNMFAKLDDLAKSRPEDLQQLGFDPSFYGTDGRSVPVLQRVEEIRAKAAAVKAHYNEAIRQIPIDQTGRIEELVRLKSRMDSMNSQIDGLNQQREATSLEYRNDPDHVKQIDKETRRLRALQENREYLNERANSLAESKARDVLGIRESAHAVDNDRLEAAKKYHDDLITQSKAKIDNLKSTYKEQLDLVGHDSSLGKYSLLKKAKTKEQSEDIKNIENRIVQLNGAINEHQHEYDQLIKPFDGAIHYRNRLASSFHQQVIDQAVEDKRNIEEEIPRSEFEATLPEIRTAVSEEGQLHNTITPGNSPEVVHTDPATLTQSMELPQTSQNLAPTIKDMVTTDGRLDQSKIDKFVHDNSGKILKVTYEGNDSGVFGIIKTQLDGKDVFVQDNGNRVPIERLLGGAIKSITQVVRQAIVVPKTEQPATPKESKVVTASKQKEFIDTMYNSSKPYLAVGLNSTTGIDSDADPTQQRWFRTTENLDLGDGKYQLLTVTSANQAAAKKLLGSDWSDNLLYDNTTIKVVLLKDGKPVKADQFGTQIPQGDIVYSSLALTPSKDKIGVIGDVKQSHRYIVTPEEVANGTVDRLLQEHKEWRDKVLSDPNTKVIDVTSKGSGIRVRGDLGPVTGRLTNGNTVDVKIAKGESISDPSGKSITVKPGLTYAEYKGMVVPLTGRNLTKNEQAIAKELMKQWSQLASQATVSHLRTQLSDAIEAKDKDKVADIKEKLRGIDPNLILTKPMSAEEMLAEKDKALAITQERNDLKAYLETLMRFGDTDEHSIYVEKGQFKFGDKAISQEDLWNNTNTEELDKFLANKFLQISSPALNANKAFDERYIENGQIKERKWNSYNDYLTSSEYPDESTRLASDIPLKTSLAPIGEAQFSSVNLRYNGITDAAQPTRTDTAAYKKVASGTQEAEKSSKRKEIPYEKMNTLRHEFGEGDSFRVELRLRDRKEGQEPFYLTYKIVDGKLQFQELTKRDGTKSTTEPKSFQVVREELSTEDSEDVVEGRPETHFEYMGISPIQDSVEIPTESVEVPQAITQVQSSSRTEDVIAELNKLGNFVGTRGELEDFITSVDESAPDVSAENMAKSYVAFNESAIAPKTVNKVAGRRKDFRGMPAGFKGQTINFEAAKKYIQERFKGIDVQRVNGLIQGKYWGMFDSAGQVLLSTDAVPGTAYHEAFHIASLLYHNEAERQSVYNEYRERTGQKELADRMVEEQLADEFISFAESEGNYKFPEKQLSFFQKLWNAIKSFVGIGGSKNIEEVFEKINNGGYYNMEVAKELGVQTTAPMNADLAEHFTTTNAILEDMTVFFFDHFFSEGNNLDTLFNVFSEGKTSLVVDNIYKSIMEEYKEFATTEDAGVLARFANEGTAQEYIKLHRQELANLGLKLIDKVTGDKTSAEENNPANLETEGQKDNAQLESHIEVSSKEGMPKIVKFFLSSLPELEMVDGTLQRVQSAYGTFKVADPEKIMNILGNQLAGMTDINQMVARIKELSTDFPTLNGLISRMQLGDELLPTTATANDARFQTLFWQQFAKANHDYYMTFLRDDGTVTILNSQSETQQAVARESWRTNLIAQLNAPNSVIQIEDNKIVIDKNKTQQLKAINDPFERAEKLGIKFTFPDKIKSNPALFKTFRENLDAIINTIIASKQPVTDLYTREGLNAQNRIRNIAELEATTNPDSIERQHIGMDNKTLYSLTLNHSLSQAVQEINSKAGAWYDAVTQSAYAQNSVVLDKIKDGFTIGLSVNEGIKRQTADGQETSKLTPADALANAINGIVNGYYSILRPGDKKLEYKLQFGEFVSSKGLINKDGNYSANIHKIFRGYLQDEFNRVFALKAGYGANIALFNKKGLLKNGRLNLGLFNDILKDTNMPVINTVEDSAKWIDENKEVVDVAVRKFLEATTNQYGANARRLSVFKETMNKTGRRTYKPTGEYMLNGIDDEVVNNVLGRTEGDRYSKSDIHQFFRYVTVNQLIGNIEQTKITTGAIEFYKDPLKRFSALTGTKKMTRVDQAYLAWETANMPKVGYINGQRIGLTQDNNVRIVTVKDITSTMTKDQLDNLREGLTANGMSKSEVDEQIKKFSNVNESDAQSWMTLPAYRQFLSRTGDWTASHEAAYSKAIRGTSLTPDEIFLFPPLKPQGFGPQQSAGVYSPLFVKTSISPLIPSVIKGTDLEQLMHKMYKSDIDMTSTESAIKVGGKVDVETNDFTPLYTNNNGVAEIDPTPYNTSLVSVLPAQYMGIQLDIAPIRKNTTTRGTQHEKLIMSNIKNIPGGQEIIKEYKDTIGKLVNLAKLDLQNRLGIKAKGDNYIIPDRGKLLSYLEEQSIARGVPTNTLIGLRAALTQGSTLDTVVNKDRIDSILSSIVTDGAIKGSRNGEQRIQVSITGYGQRVFEGNKLQTSDKLASYVYDPLGTKPMEIMTALPKQLVAYVDRIGGLAKFNEMIANNEVDERILKAIGFRIPTQQLSSMVYYKIKEFLPYESGPVVVLPSVITTIAGSDFDIDKLSVYEKNYNVKSGKISFDFRPQLRKQLTEAGLIDQFKTVTNKLPEALTDTEIDELIQYSKEQVSQEEADKIDNILLKLYKKHISDPSLEYIESTGEDRKALENKLLEINEKVLSHPANFKNLVAPVGNETLSGLADDMVKLRAKATKGVFNEFEVEEANPYPSAELMNMSYLLEQGQRFQAGKDLLGIAAKQNTHHVLSQLSELHLKPTIKVWFKEATGQQLRLDNVTDLKGKHQISDIISQFINGFVDIVKDQFTFDLNANKHTINPFFYLTRVGVPIESVTSFLNQPVIRKYIEQRNINDSLISKGLPKAYRKSNYQIIDGLRQELVYIAKGNNSLVGRWKPFDGKMPHYIESSEARDKIRATYKDLSKAQLDNMILDPNTPTAAVGQLQVLDQFLQYQQDGNQLTNLMMLNSQDTDGIKKSLARSYVEKAMYNELMKGDTIFENPETVVNNSLIKPYFDIVMEGESYFSSLFDSKSEKSNKLRHEIAHQMSSLSLDDATDLMKKFENHTVAHVLQNVTTKNFPISLSDEAIKNTVTKKEDGTVSIQPSLLLGNDSAVNSLIKFRKNLQFPNDFINSLFGIKGVDRTTGNYLDTVRMFTKRINKQQADILSGSATDLLNSNPELAKRIFRTTLIQSGLNNSYMSYHTLLPANFFHNFVREMLDVYRSQDVPTQNIIDDFYRNNWKNNTLIPTVESRILSVNGDFATMQATNPQYATSLYIKQWAPPEGMARQEFFRQRGDEAIADEDKPKWELYLYKHYDNQDGNIVFKRVNPLGQSERYQETSFEWKERSVQNSNNKVDGEFVSSENYNSFTGYRPDLGKIDPSNVPVSFELKRVFEQMALESMISKGLEGEADQAKVTEAIKTYQKAMSEGMSEEQARKLAEHKITCE